MPPVDNASDGLRRVTDDVVERQVIITAGHGSGGLSSIPQGPSASEPESLLDITGLLELARLMEKFGKDGRLSSGGEGRPEPEGIQHHHRPKD